LRYKYIKNNLTIHLAYLSGLLLFIVALSAFGQANKRVGIVYSEASANLFYDKFAYTQLFMAMQHQAMMAGVPYDLLSENDLTRATNLTKYDALLIPFMPNVTASKLSAISNALNQATSQGMGLIVSGNFLTNSETGGDLPGNAYARMTQLLGIEYVNSENGVALEVRANNVSHPTMKDYTLGEVIVDYSQIWLDSFQPIAGQTANVLATLHVAGNTRNGVLATQLGGRNVHFASDQLLGDSNLAWSAIHWVLYGNQTPVSLKLGRQTSLFTSRNDMDQSMFANQLHLTEIPLYNLLVDWKNKYNFVGSYYLNIGNNPGAGQFTDWNIAGPLYTDYIALGNEIGTHSWTHPDNTSLLSNSQLEFEFNQSRIELSNRLGIQVAGAAIPGNPESLAVGQQLAQYFEYVSGRSGVKGSGSPGAFGRMHPGANMIYYSLNMSPDFTLIQWLGQNPSQAEATWQNEYYNVSRHASQPIIHWMWHDYGPTISSSGPYNIAMYANTIAMAYNNDSEFVTLENLNARIKTFENSSLTVTGSNPITATVNANNVGQFSLMVNSNQVISQVTDWYAYDDDQVFLPNNGGQFSIQLAAKQADITRISRLPMRARLMSLNGNGTELSFTFHGQGTVLARLNATLAADFSVQGADSFTRNANQLSMKFNALGTHSVSLSLNTASNIPPIANEQSVTTDQDTAVSIMLSANDANGDPLSYAITAAPKQGQLTGTAPNLTYTPNAGFSGNDSFRFRANDGQANSNVATVSMTINPIGNTNRAPVANNQSVTTPQDTQATIALTASDPDGDTLSYTLLSNPSNGQLSGTAPNVSYTPNSGYNGNDSFTFRTNDGQLDSNTATISINITQLGGDISNPMSNLTLDGNLTEWNGLTSFGIDPNDINGANNLIDWLEAWFAHDSANFYVAIRNDGPITLSWGQNIYLDTDSNTTTGFNSAGYYPIGADYLIQSDALYQYNGTGSDWSWQLVANVTIAINNNQMELSFARSLIGNPNNIQLFFLGENSAFSGGNSIDYYPDDITNTSGATRFFRYTAQ